MMDTLTAAKAVDGRLVGEVAEFERVTTDSRKLAQGDLFVALRGERFDGHDFVAKALASGAVAAIVREARAADFAGNLIAVDDPQRALEALARHWRARFRLPVVAIVGSNGKTTTKEMLAAILREAEGAEHVAATPGNFNNAIGLPLTVLGLRENHRVAVFEIGMNHRGETGALAAVAQPTCTLVTNAQREHQEFMRTVEEVAREHADAILALPRGGIAVVNGDDAHAGLWREAAREVGASTVTFGLTPESAVSARYVAQLDGSALSLETPAGPLEIALKVPGRHMVANALAATAAALAVKVPLSAIARGLGGFRAAPGRLALRESARGVRVIDDAYNANPDSVRAAIDVLATMPGTKWLALGDMGEVGENGPAYHQEIGAYARSAGINRLFGAGPLSQMTVDAFGAGAEHFPTVEMLGGRLVEEAGPGDAVLVKGSRFMRMERVVAMLTGEGFGEAH